MKPRLASMSADFCAIVLVGLGFATVFPLAGAQQQPAPILSIGKNGKIVYESDQRGDRVPDFSHCGYAGGDQSIPNAPVRIVVDPKAGDSTLRIQKAIDYVAALNPDSNGIRGAVLLLKGRHEVSGSLLLNASGVVLRGQSFADDGTILVAAGQNRRALIRIAGKSRPASDPAGGTHIIDPYIPVGARTFHVTDASGLRTGSTISIIRPSTVTWIAQLGMTNFGGGVGDWRLPWKPGSRDLTWDRVVQSVQDGLVTVDAPITTAIEAEFGGARVVNYSWPGRIHSVGVEQLRCESAVEISNPKDEDHAWIAVAVEDAQNVWVRQFVAAHFAGSAVHIRESCKWVTVEDCLSLAPISEEGGYRRHTFFTLGQMTLFLHCWSERGRHDFAAGHCAAGPNAFVNCEASQALADSGPIESWASGVLYDNVMIDGNGLSLANRGPTPHGAGWAAANSVLWQCSAAKIICANPPTARNWAFGSWAEFEGDGVWRQSNQFVKPASLYEAQLADRLGWEAAQRRLLMRRDTSESTNPTSKQAQDLVQLSAKTGVQLRDYIAQVKGRHRIHSDVGDAKRVDELSLPPTHNDRENQRLQLRLTNGWLTVAGRLLIGATTNVAWWRGNFRPAESPAAEPAITRFVPGRTGPGCTDDLEELADSLAAAGIAALNHHYGLWYDRRRDDHQRVRRMDGNVWPPFFEQPFARSGQGTAWDGLSRYDLTRYNPWYWGRLKEFADLSDRHGLVVFHQNYFQHNVLEAGAHWTDFPWRTANNINDTDFPEPPTYAGEKRIFMAQQFYDVDHLSRRALHRAYIRKCLENFKDNSNVIQFTGAEFTGPLEFVQLWLDTIAEWEQETGRKPLIALSCTKDVQDVILGSGGHHFSKDLINDRTPRDSHRGGLIDVIDFRYWWLTDHGLFEPPGGNNLAPRQFERQWKGGRPTDLNLARMAAEYRHHHPDKAIICAFPQAKWAFLCAGGSMPNLPSTTDRNFLAAIPQMEAWPGGCADKRWALRQPGRQYLVYAGSDGAVEIDFSGEPGSFLVRAVDLNTGQLTDAGKVLGGTRGARLPTTQNIPAVFWLTSTR